MLANIGQIFFRTCIECASCRDHALVTTDTYDNAEKLVLGLVGDLAYQTFSGAKIETGNIRGQVRDRRAQTSKYLLRPGYIAG